jgi:hypothetical protein
MEFPAAHLEYSARFLDVQSSQHGFVVKIDRKDGSAKAENTADWGIITAGIVDQPDYSFFMDVPACPSHWFNASFKPKDILSEFVPFD